MVQAVAEQIGESPERIKERKVDWAAEVVKRGVIIDLHIGRTRFIRKITKEDLGLDEISDAEFQEFVNEYYDLGSKLLIPKRILLLFNRIEGRARNNLYRFTFQTPWGCFCPYTTYSKWKEGNEKLKAEYGNQKLQLMEDVPFLKEEILNEYRNAAKKLYERTNKSRSEDDFVKGFLENLETQIPTAEEIERSFYFEDNIYYIPLPTEVEEEFLRAEVTRREARIQQARTQAEIDKVQMEVQMHRDTVSRIMDSKKQKIDSLMDSVSQNLRGAIFTTLRDVLESIKARSSLSGASVKSLKGLIEKTRMMNFMGEEDVEGALLKVEEALSQKVRHSSLKNVAKVFHDIATEFRLYALEKDELPDIREFGLLL